MRDAKPTTILERIARDSSTLSLILEGTRDPYQHYIADLILRSSAIAERAKLPWEYKSLTHFGEEDFVETGNVYLEVGRDGLTPRNWHSLAAKELARSVTRNLIYEDDEGLVIYLQDKGGFRPARTGDAHYDFVKRMMADGMAWDYVMDKPPTWANELFIGTLNYDAYAAMWFDSTSISDPAHALRKRFRREAVWMETLRLSGREPFASLVVPEPGKWGETLAMGVPLAQGELDPSDLPDELSAANIAFRAVSNGYGDPSATFKNRLVAYLENEFQLSPEAVSRIATVSNPDKAPGRKKRSPE